MPANETKLLPTFLVIGAQRAGTSTLHRWLDDHPDVCMSPREDLDFFLEAGNWDRGASWYGLRFGNCQWEHARGETSARYANTHLDPGVPKRMHSLIPNARLIYLVREPIERMRSMYRHRVTEGTERRTFEDAVAQDSDYVEGSRYIERIGAFLAEYKKKQLLVVTTERLTVDPAATMAQIHKHVGVEPTPLSEGVSHRDVTDDRRLESTISLRLKANPGYWRTLNRSWRLRSLHERVLTRQAKVPSAYLPGPAEATLKEDLEKDTQALEVFMGRRLTEWGR
jgi:Sulfotransferase domain